MIRIRTLLAWAMLATGAATAEAARRRCARTVSQGESRNYAAPIDERANPRVLAAMRAVPRHLFVPSSQRDDAYDDRPLPIGEDQTISQPSLVALMTHLLRPQRGDVMLEVGTGSGYQAAILSRLVARVYTIEIVEPLARSASDRLSRLGYDNVACPAWRRLCRLASAMRRSTGSSSPPARRTCRSRWSDQLKPGGRMVIPVGPAHSVQHLLLITKARSGAVRRANHHPGSLRAADPQTRKLGMARRS